MTEQTEPMLGTEPARELHIGYRISEDLIAEAADDHEVREAVVRAFEARIGREIRKAVDAYKSKS
ncbi:hypothetical protein BH10ACT9_BH10ACT9_28400 [soil metagenome]